jgi:hypothetical protein
VLDGGIRADKSAQIPAHSGQIRKDVQARTKTRERRDPDRPTINANEKGTLD